MENDIQEEQIESDRRRAEFDRMGR